MERQKFYHWAGLIALVVALMASILAAAGLAFARADASGAAVLCAVAFFVPGLAFFNYARQLELRDQMFGRVAALTENRGVVNLNAFAQETGIRREDAEWMLRRAVAEGRIRGTFRGKDEFIASTALRCPSCGEPVQKTMGGGRCPRCGAALTS